MDAIKATICEVLTAMSEEEADTVAEHLMEEIGVEGTDDLQFVQPSDLPMLKPIQVRKLIQNWKAKPPASSEDSPTVQPSGSFGSGTSSPSGTSSSASSSSSRASSPVPAPSIFSPSRQANWSRSYVIPWDSFSKVLMKCLERKERPTPSQRREMVRILVADILKHVERPSKKQLSHIAEHIVQKYPQSFRDVVNGEVVGTGYESLLKNIHQRVHNENRKDVERTPKRNAEGAQEPAEKRRKSTDEYGCVNYLPGDLPEDHTEESLSERKQAMQVSFRRGGEFDRSDMLLTYVLQRRDIVSNALSMPELQKAWPYLFSVEGLSLHFQTLVGVDVKDSLQTAWSQKGKLILEFMQNCCSRKPTLQPTLCAIERGRAELGNDTPQMPGLLVLLMKYLGELPSCLVKEMEPTVTKEDVRKEGDLPQTPVLIACGDVLTASRWMLVIDGHVVVDDILDFLAAIGMLFASFYCFGIEYAAGAHATLDFIQRCFMKINPEKGSKVKKGSGAHPKVLSLIKAIGDYEWSM